MEEGTWFEWILYPYNPVHCLINYIIVSPQYILFSSVLVGDLANDGHTDVLISMFVLILIGSDKGTVYSSPAYKIPECSRTAAGTPLIQVNIYHLQKALLVAFIT